MTRIAVIGGGRIGEALISGLLESGRERRDVVVSEVNPERAKEVATRHGIRSTTIPDASEGADVIVIAVKPDQVTVVLTAISDTLSYADNTSIIVSVAAGISSETIENFLPAGYPVVRVMPNTPMLVRKGTASLSPGRHTKPEEVAAVREIFESVGTVVEIPESKIDAVTAVSGSGPAYFFLLIEAMVEAGVALGLSRDVAQQLAIGTAEGSAAILRETGTSPADLRAAVTSPGGTTAAAVKAFERAGFRASVFDALDACAAKSREMAAATAAEGRIKG